MPALLDIPRRPAEPADQEVAQPFLRTCQVFLRIHRAKDRIVGYLRVERANQPRKAVFANRLVDLFFSHA